jgi:hypothetical protein
MKCEKTPLLLPNSPFWRRNIETVFICWMAKHLLFVSSCHQSPMIPTLINSSFCNGEIPMKRIPVMQVQPVGFDTVQKNWDNPIGHQCKLLIISFLYQWMVLRRKLLKKASSHFKIHFFLLCFQNIELFSGVWCRNTFERPVFFLKPDGLIVFKRSPPYFIIKIQCGWRQKTEKETPFWISASCSAGYIPAPPLEELVWYEVLSLNSVLLLSSGMFSLSLKYL